jgi:hypothetical protein
MKVDVMRTARKGDTTSPRQGINRIELTGEVSERFVYY